MLNNEHNNSITVDKLDTYMKCPALFNFKYRKNAKTTNRPIIIRNIIEKAFHKYIKYYYNKVIIDKTSILIIELIDCFIDKLILNERMLKMKQLNYIIKELEELKLNVLDFDNVKKTLKKYLDYRVYDNFFENRGKWYIRNYNVKLSVIETFLLLCDYFENNVNLFNKNISVFSVEENLKYNFFRFNKEYTLNGMIDFLGKSFESFYIIDFKFSVVKWDENKLMSLYDFINSYLVYKKYGLIPIYRYIVYVIDMKKHIVSHQILELQHDINSMNKVEQNIYDILKGINSKVFYRNEKYELCSKRLCDYHKICQKYKDNIDFNIIRDLKE